jgi:FMN-dependent NADH-azoreductase
VTLALARSFLDTVAAAAPDVEIETWDLWDGTLPPFGPAAAGAKMAVIAGETPTAEEAAAWDTALAAVRRFDRADTYLFSVPMWNMSVPYILTQFIDVVSQPGRLFTFDPEAGYTGLLAGKRAAVITTSAVWGPGRGPEFGANHLDDYFLGWLNWAGVVDVSTFGFHPNLATADAAAALKQALVDIGDFSDRFVAAAQPQLC